VRLFRKLLLAETLILSATRLRQSLTVAFCADAEYGVMSRFLSASFAGFIFSITILNDWLGFESGLGGLLERAKSTMNAAHTQTGKHFYDAFCRLFLTIAYTLFTYFIISSEDTLIGVFSGHEEENKTARESARLHLP
jgi:hypothetical protein